MQPDGIKNLANWKEGKKEQKIMVGKYCADCDCYCDGNDFSNN